MSSTNDTISRNGTATRSDRIVRDRPDPAGIAISERSLLGAMICDPQVLLPFRAMISPTMFARDDHKALAEVLLAELDAAAMSGETPQNLMSANLLQRLTDPKLKPNMTESEAEGHIFGLIETWSADVEYRPHKADYLRRIASDLARVHAEAQLDEDLERMVADIDDVTSLDDKVRSIAHIADHAREALVRITDDKPICLADLLGDELDEEPEPFMRTGIRFIDANIGGIAPGDKLIFAAVPAGGKTSLVSQLTLSMLAVNPDLIATIALGEESPRQWRNRALVQLSNLATGLWRLSSDKLSPTQSVQRQRGIESLRAVAARVHFAQGPLTPAKVESVVMRTGSMWLVVDYLQMLRSDVDLPNRRDDIDAAITSLMRLSQQHGVAQCWISSMAKSAGGRRAILDCTKETGDAAYAADMAFCGEFLNSAGDLVDAPSINNGCWRVRWRNVKNRRNQPGDWHTLFRGSSMRFEEAAEL